MDDGDEADIGFLVTGGNAPKLFEIAEEILDEMTPSVHVEVARYGARSVGLGRDDSDGLPFVQFGSQPITVEGFVSKQGVKVDVRDQRLNADTIVALARQKLETDQIAECVDQCHDFGRQTAARPADFLILGPPLPRFRVGGPERWCRR